MVKIAPSILAADFTRLGEEVLAMERAQADMIHLDVMDGHFVRNISFGAPVIADLRRVTGLFFDTHLMLEHPYRFIEQFAKAGSDRITIHVECADPLEKTLERISQYGVEAGLSVSPYTPVETVYPYLPELKQVLLMTVEPGLGGQPFLEHVRTKIFTLASYRKALGLSFDIQVDGGINNQTAQLAAAHGANVLVAGSALFSQPDYTQAVADLRSAGDTGWQQFLGKIND